MLSTKGGQSESVDSLVEVLEFTHFARIFKFNRTPEYLEDSHKTILKKEISHEIKVVHKFNLVDLKNQISIITGDKDYAFAEEGISSIDNL